MSELQRVVDEAAVGRFGAAREHAEGPAGPLRDVARCLLASAGFDVPTPDPRAVAPEHRAKVLEPLFHAALARFDANARASLIGAWGDVDDVYGGLLRERMRAWDRVARGEDVRDEAEALYRRASERHDSACAVEAMVIRVWSSVAAREHDEALRLARLASRMASSERLLVPECLAHLALAHVRRVRGSPHLAARILSALRATVPRPWHAWLDLELALVASGGDARVGALVEAARAGDRPELHRRADALRTACEGFAPLAREVDALRAALDPDEDVPSFAAAFLRGAEATASFLHADAGDVDGHLAYVHVTTTRARRVLAAGAGLCADAPKVGDANAQTHRPLVLACDLALNGASEVADVFRRVYGFEYVASRHAGAFRVTLHRARASLEGLAEVRRDDERLELVPQRAFLLADPRCRLALDERVLAVLGHRSATVAELAESIGVTPRAIQKVMQRLTSEGVCEASDDRGFRVVDTTFTEPSYEVDSALFGRS